MRIIFSTYDDMSNPCYAGGGAIAIHEIASRLAGDNEVIVLTGDYAGARDETVDGVRYEHIGSARIGPRAGQILFHLAAFFAAAVRKYDVWLESFTPPWSTSLVPLATRKPVFGIVHSLSGAEMRRKYHLPFDWLERLGLRFYERIIVTTETAADSIRKLNPHADITVIGNGVKLPRQTATPGNGEVIAFLGRIEMAQKGIDLLLRAYSKLGPAAPFLDIAGRGLTQEETRVDSLIKKLGLADKVRMLGRVEDKNKAEFFKKAMFGVVPSRSESFSMSALEFLACGIPLLTFDIPGLEWIPPDVCIKVPPFDEDGFSAAMARLISEPGLRRDLAQRGRKFAGYFDWDDLAARYRLALREAFPAAETRELPVEDIIARKQPCVFVSPHLDDAALSAGGLIAHLARKVPTSIVTVFTRAGEPPHTLSAKAYLEQCGRKDAQVLYELRRMEDEKACGSVGARAVHLGFTEALWRKPSRISVFREWLGRLMPEFSHAYPTYRFHIIRGKMAKSDAALSQEIAAELRLFLRETPNAAVFVPLGIGDHVDHIVARKACELVRPRKDLIFWADHPYVGGRELPMVSGHEPVIFRGSAVDKKKFIAQYATQIMPLFGSPDFSVPADVLFVPSVAAHPVHS